MQATGQTYCKQCGCVLASSGCFHSCAIYRTQLISTLQAKIEKIFAKRTLIAQEYNSLLQSYTKLKQQNTEKREKLEDQVNELRAENDMASLRMEKDQIKKKKIRDQKRKELKMSKSKQNSQISSQSRSTYSPNKEYQHQEQQQEFMNPQPGYQQYEDTRSPKKYHADEYQEPQFYEEQEAPILSKPPLPIQEAEDIWGAPTGGEQEEEKKQKPGLKKYYGRVEMGQDLDDDYSHAPPDAKVKNSFRKKLSDYAYQEKITELLKYPEKQKIDLIVNSVCDALDFELHKGRVIGALMICNLKKMAMMNITEDLEDIVDTYKILGSVGRSFDGQSMVCYWLIKKVDLRKVQKKYSIFDSYSENWKITDSTRKKDIVRSMWQYWGDKVKAKEYSYFKLILL